MTNSFDQFFEGGGKSMTFGRPGSQEAAQWFGKPRGGRILSIGDPVQQTGMQGTDQEGELLFWDKAKTRPKMMVVITLDTNTGPAPERLDSEDDGCRALYAKGGIQQAITDALREAKAKIQVGGELLIAWVGEEPAKNPSFNNRRIFKAKYTPPVASEATGEFFGLAQGSPVSAPLATAGLQPSAFTQAVNNELAHQAIMSAGSTTFQAPTITPPGAPAGIPADQAAAFAAWQASQQQAAPVQPPAPAQPNYNPQVAPVNPFG